MNPRIEREAERTRNSQGSQMLQRRKKQVRTAQQKEKRRIQQSLNRENERKRIKAQRARLERIHPEVLKASAEELIEAGWGEYERYQIPANWKGANAAILSADR